MLSRRAAKFVLQDLLEVRTSLLEVVERHSGQRDGLGVGENMRSSKGAAMTREAFLGAAFTCNNDFHKLPKNYDNRSDHLKAVGRALKASPSSAILTREAAEMDMKARRHTPAKWADIDTFMKLIAKFMADIAYERGEGKAQEHQGALPEQDVGEMDAGAGEYDEEENEGEEEEDDDVDEEEIVEVVEEEEEEEEEEGGEEGDIAGGANSGSSSGRKSEEDLLLDLFCQRAGSASEVEEDGEEGVGSDAAGGQDEETATAMISLAGPAAAGAGPKGPK